MILWMKIEFIKSVKIEAYTPMQFLADIYNIPWNNVLCYKNIIVSTRPDLNTLCVVNKAKKEV